MPFAHLIVEDDFHAAAISDRTRRDGRSAMKFALATKFAALHIDLLARPIPLAALVLGVFGATYLGATLAMGTPARR